MEIRNSHVTYDLGDLLAQPPKEAIEFAVRRMSHEQAAAFARQCSDRAQQTAALLREKGPPTHAAAYDWWESALGYAADARSASIQCAQIDNPCYVAHAIQCALNARGVVESARMMTSARLETAVFPPDDELHADMMRHAAKLLGWQ